MGMPEQTGNGKVGFREAVTMTLSMAGTSILKNYERFLSYLLDLADGTCVEMRALSALSNRGDGTFLQFFSDAVAEGTADSLNHGAHLAARYMEDSYATDHKAAWKLADGLAGGIADHLGIAYGSAKEPEKVIGPIPVQPKRRGEQPKPRPAALRTTSQPAPQVVSPSEGVALREAQAQAQAQARAQAQAQAQAAAYTQPMAAQGSSAAQAPFPQSPAGQYPPSAGASASQYASQQMPTQQMSPGYGSAAGAPYMQQGANQEPTTSRTRPVLLVAAVLAVALAGVIAGLVFGRATGMLGGSSSEPLAGHDPGVVIEDDDIGDDESGADGQDGTAPSEDDAGEEIVFSDDSAMVGNLTNGGYVCEDDGWVYYATPKSAAGWSTNSIVRTSKSDSTRETVYSVSGSDSLLWHINPVGDYLVFQQSIANENPSVMRVRKDGSGDAVAIAICDDNTLCQVYKGLVYFERGGSIRSVKLDGTDEKAVASLGNDNRWRIHDDKIYTYSDKKGANLSTMPLSGGSKSTLFGTANGTFGNVIPTDQGVFVLYDANSNDSNDTVYCLGTGAALLLVYDENSYEAMAPGISTPAITRMNADGDTVIIATKGKHSGRRELIRCTSSGSRPVQLKMTTNSSYEYLYLSFANSRVFAGVVGKEPGKSKLISIGTDGSGERNES